MYHYSLLESREPVLLFFLLLLFLCCGCHIISFDSMNENATWWKYLILLQHTHTHFGTQYSHIEKSSFATSVKICDSFRFPVFFFLFLGFQVSLSHFINAFFFSFCSTKDIRPDVLAYANVLVRYVWCEKELEFSGKACIISTVNRKYQNKA